jgi:hypothetical protein
MSKYDPCVKCTHECDHCVVADNKNNPPTSRQQIVEPQTFKPISNETAEAVAMSMQRAFEQGRSAALREAVEAVEQFDIMFDEIGRHYIMDKIIAAIRALEVKP